MCESEHQSGHPIRIFGLMTPLLNSSYADIGGMDIQKQEIREAVELPLTQFDLYRQIGIEPPRGVLLYGPPGELLLSKIG